MSFLGDAEFDNANVTVDVNVGNVMKCGTIKESFLGGKVTVKDCLVLEGTITFQDPQPMDGEVLTFESGVWTPAESTSGSSTEHFVLTGTNLDETKEISFIDINGTGTLLDSTVDGFTKRLIKTVGAGSFTVTYNGGTTTMLTNIGDSVKYVFDSTASDWIKTS